MAATVPESPPAPHESAESPDAELVRAVLGGDDEAFTKLMRRYNPRVFRIARSILKNDSEAEDASQDAFVTAYRKLDQLQTPEAFSGWLSRIAARNALRRVRQQSREEEWTVQESQGPTPDRRAEIAQLREALERAVDGLPIAYRTVLVMRDVQHMSSREVAETLELEVGAVRVRLHRARAMMRQSLGAAWGPDAESVFSFDGERCDRLVARVRAALGHEPPNEPPANEPL